MALKSARFWLFAGALALSACGGGNSPGARSPMLPGQTGASQAVPGPSRGDASWISPEAKAQNLLYVSNRKDGSVYIYSYPQGRLTGWLVNLEASGLCAGANGDVFIPEGDEVKQYAHGETQPAATLRGSLGGKEQFCAVDRASGDLAVSGGTTANGVAVYAMAKGEPTIYRARNGDVYRSLTYDNAGDLFAVAAVGSTERATGIIELPKGDSRVRSVTWDGKRPSALQSIAWDGQYLAIASPGNGSRTTTISRYRVNGKQLSEVDQTTLTGAGSPLQFAVHAGQIVVPNPGARVGEGAGLAFYDYPRGSEPKLSVDDDRQPQAAAVSSARAGKIAVTTYHYDTMRTGWDNKETTLTYSNVNSSSFGLQHAVSLDDQVDTQPLVVPNETTTTGVDPGKHDVVYVTTESDSVYAIDASSGTVLIKQSLGNPVPTPLGCNNNGPNVGINGTPVIDKKANVMYVIAYTQQSTYSQSYYIHELSLANLQDVVSPVLVTASHVLSNDTSYTFNATYQRQRPALLEANGNIYAGFGSFCDFAASNSRGWLLGWQAGSLTPLAANQLNNTLASSPYDFFLSSIWMAGNGIAADPEGNLYFVTGNSDPSGESYNPVTNIAETAAKLSPDLTQLLSYFTPDNESQLDQGDTDFGSGGILLLPRKRPQPPLATAAGKDGTMYLMDRKSMGGYSTSANHVVDSKYIGGCWCGESYFDAASDSIPRIVGSGGNSLTVWKVPLSRHVTLSESGAVHELPGGQDPGFFTAVSSDGKKPGAIIWALTRPAYVPGNITLFAFESQPATNSGTTLTQLYDAPAGSWESTGGDADLVPVVANGQVFVASYQQLDIFGLLGNSKRLTPSALVVEAPHAPPLAPHQVTGKIVTISGTKLTLRTRGGELVHVDASVAVRRERSVDLLVGEPVTAMGTRDAAGVLHATIVVRAKPSSTTWPPDR